MHWPWCEEKNVGTGTNPFIPISIDFFIYRLVAISGHLRFAAFHPQSLFTFRYSSKIMQKTSVIDEKLLFSHFMHTYS